MPARLAVQLVLAWALIAGVSLATHTLMPVDETRYATVAWNMWWRGDFLVPWLNDVPYHHKPPLLFWAIHAGWAVTGVNEWWPRIAPGLFGLAAVFMSWHVARRLWPQDELAARLTPVVLLGCLWWALFASATMFDMLVACFTVLGMIGVLNAAQGRLLQGFVLVGVALGFGLLSKGPTILLQVLPAAVLAPWWADRRPAGGWGRWYVAVLLSVLLGAAIILAWAIPAAIRGGPEYTRMIFWGQTANRMVQSFAHREPAWWYVALAPAMVFPWLFWPPALRALARTRRHLDNGLRFCLAWSVPVFVAFSAISGKQAHYLLPLLPAFALVLARMLSRTCGTVSRISQLPVALVLVGFGIAIGFAGVLAPRFGGAAWISAVPTYGGAALALWGLFLLLPARQRLEHAAAALAGASIVTVFTADFAVIRVAADAYDQRPIARYLQSLEARQVPVAHLGKYHGQFQFHGRLRRTPEVIDAERIEQWFAAHPDGRLIAYFRKLPADAHPEFTQGFAGRRVAVFDQAGWASAGRPEADSGRSSDD
jgi:4-amino-4-deoxy-L-arabinose transferase-like glycosyltransferase